MGHPAARQGDMTAHGGSIVQGDPTVLINGQPAARQGDMHVCPMCNGPVPHVGGPILQGAPTVLINGQPAARLGDVCTCNGPPDSIVMGDTQVLIGSGGNPVKIGGQGQVMIGGSGPVLIGGGAASGGGGGGGGSGVQGAALSAASAESLSPEATALEEHWLDFTFEDAAGNAVSGVPYELEGPEGTTSESWLRGEGLVRRSGLSEGEAAVTLRQVSGAEWSTTEAKVGDEVVVTAEAKGFKEGTPVTVQIKRVPMDGGPATIVDDVETEVSGEEIEVTWAYTYEKTQAASDAGGQQLPAYAAEVRVEGYPLPTATDLLRYKNTIEFEYYRPDSDEPVPSATYHISFANGEVRTGTTDQSGKVKEEDVPPVGYDISFA